jgi:predicted DNA-binding transcriptional regulator AlpA
MAKKRRLAALLSTTTPEPPDSFEDRRVLTLPEFRRRNKLSRTTYWRLKVAGETPATIQLSARREGITVAEERRWQQSRTVIPVPRPVGRSASSAR